jgi:hypothetical protein
MHEGEGDGDMGNKPLCLQSDFSRDANMPITTYKPDESGAISGLVRTTLCSLAVHVYISPLRIARGPGDEQGTASTFPHPLPVYRILVSGFRRDLPRRVYASLKTRQKYQHIESKKSALSASLIGIPSS